MVDSRMLSLRSPYRTNGCCLDLDFQASALNGPDAIEMRTSRVVLSIIAASLLQGILEKASCRWFRWSQNYYNGLFDTYHHSLKPNGEIMEKYLVKHGGSINDFPGRSRV
jgi:hypothetical protein